MRFQFVLKNDRKSSGQKEVTKIKPKRNAGDLAKNSNQECLGHQLKKRQC